MTWQDACWFALKVYGVAAEVSMAAAVVLRGTYSVVHGVTKDSVTKDSES